MYNTYCFLDKIAKHSTSLVFDKGLYALTDAHWHHVIHEINEHL